MFFVYRLVSVDWQLRSHCLSVVYVRILMGLFAAVVGVALLLLS